MFTRRVIFLIVALQCYIILCFGMCDRRKFGGELKCCTKKDSTCFVKVSNNRTRGQTNTICYCDSYCKFTNDCCKDQEKALRICRNQGSRDCIVSGWGKWGQCSAQCGFGTMKRKRHILQYPKNGGRPCPFRVNQARGCNVNAICEKSKYNTAFILPIAYRRPTFGKWLYEKILPAANYNDNPENIQTPKLAPTYSYCVHYKVTFKLDACENTWASSLESHVPVCTECQSRVMDGGHCPGEGAVGMKSRWKALGLHRCRGDWIRLGPIIPNCTCKEKQFSNFVFV